MYIVVNQTEGDMTTNTNEVSKWDAMADSIPMSKVAIPASVIAQLESMPDADKPCPWRNL